MWWDGCGTGWWLDGQFTYHCCRTPPRATHHTDSLAIQKHTALLHAPHYATRTLPPTAFTHRDTRTARRGPFHIFTPHYSLRTTHTAPHSPTSHTAHLPPHTHTHARTTPPRTFTPHTVPGGLPCILTLFPAEALHCRSRMPPHTCAPPLPDTPPARHTPRYTAPSHTHATTVTFPRRTTS